MSEQAPTTTARKAVKTRPMSKKPDNTDYCARYAPAYSASSNLSMSPPKLGFRL